MSDEPRLRLPPTPAEVDEMRNTILDLRADLDNVAKCNAAADAAFHELVNAKIATDAELAQARAEAVVMANALEAVDLSGDTCVVCRVYQEHGHDGNCLLDWALHTDLAEQGRRMLAAIDAGRTFHAKMMCALNAYGIGNRDPSVIADAKTAEIEYRRALAAHDQHKEQPNGQEESETQVRPAQADDGVGGGKSDRQHC